MDLTEILKKSFYFNLLGKKPKPSLFRSLFLCLSLIVSGSLAYYINYTDRRIEERKKQMEALEPELNDTLDKCSHLVKDIFDVEYKRKPRVSGDFDSALESIALRDISIKGDGFLPKSALRIRKLFRTYPFIESIPISAFTSNGIIYYINPAKKTKKIESDEFYTLSHELGHCYIDELNPLLRRDFPGTESDYVANCLDEGVAEYFAITMEKWQGNNSGNSIVVIHSRRKHILLKEGITLETLKNKVNQYALGYMFLDELIGASGYEVYEVKVLEKIIKNPPVSIQELIHPKEEYWGRFCQESFSEEEKTKIKGFFEESKN